MQQLGVLLDAGYFIKNKFIGELSTKQLKKIGLSGINYKVLIEDVSAFYHERNEEILPGEQHDLLYRDAKDNYPTPENFELGSMGGFHTNSELLSELDEMRDLFPELISEKATITEVL